MAFIENFPTTGKLETWFKAVSPRGVLCGLGYNLEPVKQIVDSFREKHGLPFQASGGLWVIPVGGIANAG